MCFIRAPIIRCIIFLKFVGEMKLVEFEKERRERYCQVLENKEKYRA
jgi:hypothetical protein